MILSNILFDYVVKLIKGVYQMTQANANEITEAIEKATVKMNQYLAETGEDYYCGFAWVNVIVTRTNSAQAKELMLCP